jgi:hypothetical protein
VAVDNGLFRMIWLAVVVVDKVYAAGPYYTLDPKMVSSPLSEDREHHDWHCMTHLDTADG